MPDATSPKAAPDRRAFLRLAGLGTVATGAALVTGEAADAAPVEPAGSGYRETDHVRAVYAAARF